jgi:hypothetical protein
MPVTYEDALTRWDRSRAFGDPRDFQAFANDMESLQPGEGFGQVARRDGWWTRASTRADTSFFHPLAEVTTQPIGEEIGSWFGPKGAEVGRNVGRALPRMVAQTLPLAAAAATGVGAVPAAVATGALFGGQTYAETGSPTAAAISGVTAGALPEIGGIGGRIATKYAPEWFSPVVSRLAGSQTAQIGALQTSQYLQSRATGTPYDPADPNFWATQIPFTALDIVHAATAKAEVPKAREAVVVKPVEKPYEPPTKASEDATVAATLDQMQTVLADETASPEMKEAVVAAALNVSLEPKVGVGLKQQPTEDVTSVTGYARKMINGNYKVLVPDDEGGDKTVFVNGVEPTTNPDGTVTFAAKPSQVKASVTSPLTRRDFGLLRPGEAELPVQPKEWAGFPPDMQRTLEEHGAAVPPVEMPEDVRANLRAEAEKIQQMHEQIATTKEAVAKVPQTAEEWTGIVHRYGGPGQVGAGDYYFVGSSKGKTEIPTVEKRIYLNNPLRLTQPADAGHEDQVLSKSDFVRQLTGKTGLSTVAEDKALADYAKGQGHDGIVFTVEKGQDWEGNGWQEVVDLRSEADKAKDVNLLVQKNLSSGATPTQAVEQARLAAQTPQLDEALRQLAVSKEKVQSVWKGKPQAKYGEAVRDESGKNFPTKAVAEAYRDADPDLKDHVVRNAGRDKGFYLAPQINKEVSLEGTQLEKVLEVPATVPGEVAPQNRPEVSFRDAIDSLDRAIEEPQVLARVLGLDPNEPLDVIQATKYAKQAREIYRQTEGGKPLDLKIVNEALKSQGSTPIADEGRAQRILQIVGAGIDEFNGRYRNWGLESAVPHDEALVQKIGVREGGLPAVLDWYTKRPEAGLLGTLVGDLKLALPDLSKVLVSYNQREGWRYFEHGPDIQRINIPYLPTEATADGWALNVTHEVAHYASKDLLARNDPAAVRFKATLVEVLNALKNSKELPQKVRDAVALSSKNGWYRDFHATGDGKLMHDRWTNAAGVENEDWFQVFYGLQNPEELLSQTFGSHRMVELMQKVRMPKTLKDTVLQYFSRAWNAVFGGGKPLTDSALERVLLGFDDYLSGPKLGQDVPYGGRDFIRDSLVANGVRPEALASRVQSIEQTFADGSLGASIAGFEREGQNGHLPATVTAEPLNETVKTALQIGVPQDIYHGTMNLLAEDVPVHADLWWQMKQDLDVATQLYTNVKKGLVPGELPENAKENLQLAQVKLNAMRRALTKQAAALERFNQLSNFTLDGMENTFGQVLEGRSLPGPPDPTGLEPEAQDLLGLKRSSTSRGELEKGMTQRAWDWVNRNLMLTQHAKQLIPGVRPVVDHVQAEQGDAFTRMTRLNFVRGYNPETGALDRKLIDTTRRVEQNPSLSKAASDIRRWINVQNKEGKKWSLDDTFVKEVLGRSGDPKAVLTELQSEFRRWEDFNDQIVPQFLAKLNNRTTAYLIAARETGMKPDVARDLSEQMYSALGMLKQQETAPYGMETLRMLAEKMQPDTYLKALQMSKELIDSSEKHIAFRKSTPIYTSEQRFDAHHIVMMTPDGKPYRASFKTRELAQERIVANEKAGYKFLDYIPKSDAVVAGKLSDELIASMKELDLQTATRLAEYLKDKPDLYAQVLPMTQRASDYDASQASFTSIPGGTVRKFVAGREGINMVTNSNLMYTRYNNWMRHKLVRAESDLDMLDPDLMSNRASMKYVRQHVENQLASDNQLTRQLVQGTYYWKLAWNFGVNVLHGIQSLTTGMTQMIAETGGVGDAFKLTAGAQKSMIQRMVTGKWDSAEHKWLADKLVSQGHAGIASWADIYGDQLVTLREAAHSTNPLLKAGGLVQKAADSWTGMFLKFNDLVGSFGAFDLAKERGMSNEEAYNFAVDVKNRAYYTGGKAQRAVGSLVDQNETRAAVDVVVADLHIWLVLTTRLELATWIRPSSSRAFVQRKGRREESVSLPTWSAGGVGRGGGTTRSRARYGTDKASYWHRPKSLAPTTYGRTLW